VPDHASKPETLGFSPESDSFFKVFKKPVQRRKEEVYLKEGIRSQITLGLTGCNGAQQNW
jgi:hypothetical protein